MNTLKRPVLGLPKLDTEMEEDAEIVIDFLEVLLPCRRFNISYKVSEKGGVSLTSEFLLRLLYAVDGMDEFGITEFFGFNIREFNFVMSEVTNRDFVYRNNGKVWLTATGRQLFLENEAVPQIFKVEKRNKKVGFDLLSLSPQESDKFDKFASQLIELPILDVELLANATKQIPKSFQKHFSEITIPRNGRYNGREEYLYSVDTVSAEQRFQSIVPVYVTSSTQKPSNPSPDLTHWKIGHELDDRMKISESISAHMHELETMKRADDLLAYNYLYEIAPEFLKDFMRKDGMAVERYYKSALTKVGDMRIDRPTIPLLGSIFTPNNNPKLIDAITYGLKTGKADLIQDKLFWLLPNTHWGHTQVLPVTLDSIKQKITSKEGNEVNEFEFIAMTQNSSPAKHLKTVFHKFLTISEISQIPPTMEILYIPDVVVAVQVHTPIGSQRGYPVPLGILSFDSEVIARTKLLIEKGTGYNLI